MHGLVRLAGRVIKDLPTARARPAAGLAELDSSRPRERKQTARVTRHIELGHHANAAVARVADHLRDVVLGVVPSLDTGERRREVWEALRFDRETAKVARVQVQDVEFDAGHCVEQVLDRIKREEAPARVEHEAAPLVVGLINDRDRIVRHPAGAHELRQPFQCICGSKVAAGLNVCSWRRPSAHRQRVVVTRERRRVLLFDRTSDVNVNLAELWATSTQRPVVQIVRVNDSIHVCGVTFNRPRKPTGAMAGRDVENWRDMQRWAVRLERLRGREDEPRRACHRSYEDQHPCASNAGKGR